MEFCNRFVIQDEAWVCLSCQPRKQQNRAWLQPGISRSQVVPRTLADRKVMLLVAFTPNKRFSIVSIPAGEKVDAKMIEFIWHIDNVRRSNPIRLSEVLWQWDNARPHSAQVVKDYVESRGFLLLGNSLLTGFCRLS